MSLSAERPGAEVGPYRLLKPIGEGGMGVVYLAEQMEPVNRRVALKVIRPGMDSRAVVARFEAERQALAVMDHPNIARVLDAATTPAGRPYFVMELVHGVPITTYCDSARLTPAQRLELFLPVCEAIQHAHQKGIIHRDIKPSNVIVAEVDGRPVPKIIDFGVARAIDRDSGDAACVTQHGVIVGTPEYMSPEQAEPTERDIDTRSDIYSLGVLLYELLTGTTPLDRDTLRRAAVVEILRRVREEEPPKPSTRLSGTGDRLPSVAAVRGVEPARLSRLVRGELDWIVMKALDKDRSRRYASASSLAADVRRYLAGDPVEASPSSRLYRIGKFASKHRAALTTAASFLVLLLATTGLSTWQAWRATRAETLAGQRLKAVEEADTAKTAALLQSEEARKQAEAVSSFLVEVFRSPDPEEGNREVKVAELLDQAEANLERSFPGPDATRGKLLRVLGETYLGLGWPDKAQKVFKKASDVHAMTLGENHPETLTCLGYLAVAIGQLGRTEESIKLHEQVLERQSATLGATHPNALASRCNLALARHAAGRVDESIRSFEELLGLDTSIFGTNDRRTLKICNNLAMAYMDAGRSHDAIALFEPTVERQVATLGADHADTLVSRINLAVALHRAARTAEAIAMNESTLKLLESKYGPGHSRSAAVRSNLALCYEEIGRAAEAVALLESALELLQSRLSPDHPNVLIVRKALSTAYGKAGRMSNAIPLQEQTLRIMESKLGVDHRVTRDGREALAYLYWMAGRLDRSVPLFEHLLRQRIARDGPDHPNTLRTMANLGVNLEAMGRTTEGVQLMEEALSRARGKPDAEAATAWVARELARVYEHLGRLDEVEPLLGESLQRQRLRVPPESPDLARSLAQFGQILLQRGKSSEAETILRECLKIRVAKLPDHWSRFNATSMLGEALLGQGRHADAEPLLVDGYEGLKAREASISASGKPQLVEAADRVVRLYESWGKPDEAAAWRTRLGLLPANVFAPP
jgi:serine/threonine protein kinase/tetratricopeptide (TPR) repeat protein